MVRLSTVAAVCERDSQSSTMTRLSEDVHVIITDISGRCSLGGATGMS